MKKEIVSVMMAACLFASLATGCGTANESETSSKSGSEAASVTSASEEAAGAVSKSGDNVAEPSPLVRRAALRTGRHQHVHQV